MLGFSCEAMGGEYLANIEFKQHQCARLGPDVGRKWVLATLWLSKNSLWQWFSNFKRISTTWRTHSNVDCWTYPQKSGVRPENWQI